MKELVKENLKVIERRTNLYRKETKKKWGIL